jgi:hypothetical protein
VEVDCQTLVKAIKDRSESRASWAGLIEEIRGVIALLLGSQVKHVRRDANKAAHSLAQRALRSHGWVVMRLSVPEKRFVVSLKLRQQGTVLFLVPVTLFSLINIAALVRKKERRKLVLLLRSQNRPQLRAQPDPPSASHCAVKRMSHRLVPSVLPKG